MVRKRKEITKRIEELAQSLESEYHTLVGVFKVANIRIPSTPCFAEDYALGNYPKMYSFLMEYALNNGYQDLLNTDELAEFSRRLYNQMFIFN